VRTRDEILHAMACESFSVRRVFFDYLDSRRRRYLGTGETVAVSWPDALMIIAISEWNDAYEHAIDTSDARIVSS